MRKLAIVVALSSTVLATPALARDGAWYVGGDFGGMIVEDIGFDFGLTPTVPSQSDSQVVVDHDYGFDGSLFAGYDFGAFRLEAEVAYKRASTETADGTIATSPLLEPVMRVEVTMPPEFAGDVIQSLIARRGRLQSQDTPNDRRVVCALVPLAELFGFDCDLRQRTRGRGTFLQQFDSYQPVGVDPGATDDDRSARVGAPLKPVSPQKPSAIALPEPEDDGPEV